MYATYYTYVFNSGDKFIKRKCEGKDCSCEEGLVLVADCNGDESPALCHSCWLEYIRDKFDEAEKLANRYHYIKLENGQYQQVMKT